MKTGSKRRKSIRIVVVDRDPLVAEAFRMGVGVAGDFTLQAACATGPEALAIVTKLPPGQRPDLVILEIGLPEVDGYKVCHALRRHSPSLPIAFYTTHRLPCFVNGARYAEADAYFCKPMPIHELMAELRQVHRTKCLLIDPKVLMGGVTGGLTLFQQPQFRGREEQILELDAAGLRVSEMSNEVGLHEQTLYRILRSGLEQTRVASRTFETVAHAAGNV